MIFELVTTRNCNLNCKYCFEGEKKNESMEKSIIPQIIDFIESQMKQTYVTDKENVHIDFNGGEALLNKKFIVKFIQETEKYGYEYSMTTNGILLDQEIINLVNEKKILLQISLDGKKKTHDLNRLFYNNKGSFNIVYNKLKEIQRKCFEDCLTITTVVTPKTVNNLSENVSFFIKSGFNDINIGPCADFKWEDKNYCIFEKEMKKIGDLYINCFENNHFINISPITRNIRATLRDLSKFRCDAVVGELAILPNGDVLPCGGFVGCNNEKDFYIGSITSGIDNNKIRYFTENYGRDNEECINCSFFKRCQNDCYAVNNRINHDLLKPLENTCIINQIEIKEADRVFNYLLKMKNSLFIEKYLSPEPKEKGNYEK